MWVKEKRVKGPKFQLRGSAPDPVTSHSDGRSPQRSTIMTEKSYNGNDASGLPMVALIRFKSHERGGRIV